MLSLSTVALASNDKALNPNITFAEFIHIREVTVPFMLNKNMDFTFKLIYDESPRRKKLLSNAL
jgi:hypothetical protein